MHFDCNKSTFTLKAPNLGSFRNQKVEFVIFVMPSER